jgi:hypothetical protein
LYWSLCLAPLFFSRRTVFCFVAIVLGLCAAALGDFARAKAPPREAKEDLSGPALARAISRLLQSAPLQAPFHTLALLRSEPRLAIELLPANRPNKGTVEAANIAKLRHKAEQGDANARNEFGVALAAGRGIARDLCCGSRER